MEKRGNIDTANHPRCDICDAAATHVAGGLAYCATCLPRDGEKAAGKPLRRVKLAGVAEHTPT